MGEGGVGTPGVGRRVCEGMYRRRQPEGSLLYRAVQENLATLREEAAEVGRGLPRYVERDFSKYLECGVLAQPARPAQLAAAQGPPQSAWC